jgi:hypothetical protein
MQPIKSYDQYLKEMHSDGPEKEIYRKLMEVWGTEFRRELFGKNYWVERLDIWAQDNCKSDVLIIPDVRFYTEVNYVEGKMGELIWVKNIKCQTSEHPAESQLNDFHGWNFIVDNSHDFDWLEEQAKKVVNEIKLK